MCTPRFERVKSMEQYATIESAYRLLPMQQGILFHSVSTPHSGAYIGQVTCRLAPGTDLALFERAWQYVVQRYAILRTSFIWEDQPEPTQRVHTRVPLVIHLGDWRHLSPEGQRQEEEKLLITDGNAGFDLSVPPLMRLFLFELPHGEHLFIWSHHHALLDGRARVLVLKDVARIYEALQHGDSIELPPVPSYRDYIEWFYSQDQADAREHWRHLLQDSSSSSSLTDIFRTDRDPAAVRHVLQQITIRSASLFALKRIVHEHRSTLNTAIQAVWAVMLAHYTGEEDVIFGETRACRRGFPDAASIAGVLINTVPVRLLVHYRKSFIDLLMEMREQHLRTRAFENLPLPDILSCTGIKAGASLFETIVVMEEYALADALRHSSVSLWQGIQRTSPSHYPLSLLGYLRPELSLAIAYDSFVFSPGVIRRMAQQFKTLLEVLAANPSGRLEDLPLLSPVDLQQLTEWNSTAAAYSQLTIAELFQEQVEKNPAAVALVCGDQQLSYYELDRQANRVARYLRRLGVRPEVRVGVAVGRSVEMIVSLLAILKAGGVCVPLDSNYPVERLLYMLRDSSAPVLLAQSAFQEQFSQYDGITVFIDKDRARFSNEDPAPLTDGGCCDHLAALVYTSGSTGLPKGAGIRQRSIVRLVNSTNYAVFSNSDVFLQFVPVSFDVSFFEIWGSILNGARLVLMPPGPASLEELGDTLRRCQITTLWLTAGLFHEMVDHQLSALRVPEQLLAGGDVLSLPHVEKFLEAAGEDVCLINGYGPTENTTFTCCHHMKTGMKFEGRVPIGRPIANTQVYVLDQNLRLAPIGGVGELYTGGEGLARGYTDPVLTAQKFVPDDCSGASGARLYRTGDRARWCMNGTLDFLGRLDNQVKIRGYRIEPEEIQNAVARCEGVHEAAVVVHEHLGEERLIAFVTSGDGHPLEPAGLRKELQQRLPAYMIPAAFISLERLPLTPNGKLDRQALIALGNGSYSCPGVLTPPCNAREELLAVIWSDVLKRDSIDVHANFFDLGGHSLLAMQLSSRIRTAFGMEISFSKFLENLTIADLANYMEKKMKREREGQFIPIRRASLQQAPLSFAQQRLWFLREFAPDAVHYNIPLVLHLTGPLDHAVLRRAIEQIVSRHEILRTIFRANEGDPVQVVCPLQPVELAMFDLEGIEEFRRQSELRRYMVEAGRHRFDLTCEFPVKATLLRCGPLAHTLVIVMHHIAADGWSVGIFMRELIALYQAFSAGEASPLPELPLQYADYALWEQQWLQTEMLAGHLRYWKDRLAGAPTVLELPAFKSRSPVQKHAGAKCFFHISGDQVAALHRFCRRHSSTLHMTVSAAFAALLHIYTGNDDFLISTPVAGRNRSEIEALIGFFINTLVLRCDLSGTPDFYRLLKRMRETTLDAYTHQELPFETLVSELQPKRDLSRQPLVQVMIVLQDREPEKWNLGNVTATTEILDNGTSKMDLLLSLAETSQGMRGFLEYDTDIYDQPMMERLGQHYMNLLAAVMADPYLQVRQVSLLTETESSQILGWNIIQTRPASAFALHNLFEEQVGRIPATVAVVCEGRKFTYAELNARANQLAHYLRKMGLGPDLRAGICMERSLELIVSILAVLKAGGAYVPMDPDYPAERLRFMAADSDIRILLTQDTLLHRLPNTCRRILVDEDWAQIARESTNNPGPMDLSNNIAYVIYTSGSTGKPKGVMVTHDNVIHLLESASEYYRFSSADIWTLFHSYTFDFSVWEIWGALACGGRLIVVPFHVSRSPEDFYSLVQLEKVTILNQTPSAFYQFIEQDNQRRASLDLRCVIFGGEALVLRNLAPWFERHPETRPVMVNMFGITETTVHVTLQELHQADTLQNASLIGCPIPGLQLYVLDESLQLLPLGVAGEMYVGGDGLARGYLDRPDLTAGRFVPHPFSAVGGRRLYRTGDRARFRPDGSLEYLGRLDHQIKIRGYRIELSEIEAALESHPAIKQAVALVQEDSAGEKRLLAYLTRNEDAGNLQSGVLRSYLKKQLPEYMVPAVFVFLEQFPLTVNGKVDRRALPAVTQIESSEEDYVAPHAAAEQVLAGIWSEVLNVQRVGIYDNFFDLGGHSLLAIKVASRIRAAFQVDVSLRMLFERPLLSELAGYLESLNIVPQEDPSHSIATIDRTQELPLSFNQEGRLLREWAERLRGVPIRAFHNTFGFRLLGRLHLPALENAINEIIRRHEVLRVAFVPGSLADVGKWISPLLQGLSARGVTAMHNVLQTGAGLFKVAIDPDARLDLAIADFTGASGTQLNAELLKIADQEAQVPFDYSKPPLLRATLLKIAAEEHLLIITMHHMIADHWSIELFRNELALIYAAGQGHSGSGCPELPVQYLDFAAWQRRRLTADLLEKMVAYWTKRWLDFPLLDSRELPFISPQRGQAGGAGGIERLVFNALFLEKLQEFARRKNVTLNVIFLASLYILLHLYTGKYRIGIWGNFVNRLMPETENLIGWFANNHVLGIEISPDQCVDDLLQSVSNMVLEADAHQEVPFSLLWMTALQHSAANPGMDLHPAPYIVFDLKTRLFESTSPGDLKIERFSLPEQALQLALYFAVLFSGGEATLTALYSRSSFSSSAMQAVLDNWRKVFETMIASPGAKISEFPVLAGYADQIKRRPRARVAH